MSIDKSLSQYQQLVKKGNGNKRPGYRGDDWGGPSYGGSSSKSSSGGNGSHDRGGGQHRAAAQKAAPAKAPEPDRRSIALANQYVEPVIAQPTIDTGPKRDMHDFEIKKRGITTVTGGGPHTEGPIDRIVYQPSDLPKRAYDPRTDPNALLKRPSGVLGTLGKIALTGLTAGAGAGLFGKDIATVAKLANYKKRYDALQKTALGKKLGLKELDLRNLTSNIDKAKGRQFDPKDPIGWTGEQKRTKTFHEGKGDGEASIAKKVAGGEDVVTKTANQFAGTEVEGQIADLVQNDLNQALKYYSMMTPKIEAGKANKQEMDAYELLGYYLNEVAPKQQNVAYGGRIDKPLTGRSRDI